MVDIIVVFSSFLGLIFILATIAIWSPRNPYVKSLALITSAILMGIAYFSLTEMLGRPKPIESEILRRNTETAVVVWYGMVEGKAIYLLLNIPEEKTPLFYVIPWNDKLAKQLHGAKQTAKENGTRVRMGRPFEFSFDRYKRLFYALPQEAPPLKDKPEENIFRFKGNK